MDKSLLVGGRIAPNLCLYSNPHSKDLRVISEKWSNRISLGHFFCPKSGAEVEERSGVLHSLLLRIFQVES